MIHQIEWRLPCDTRGRIEFNRRSNAALPRFCFARTALGNTWRFRGDLVPERVAALARLAGREPPLSRSATPPERLQAFADQLDDTEVRRFWLYGVESRSGTPPPGDPGKARWQAAPEGDPSCRWLVEIDGSLRAPRAPEWPGGRVLGDLFDFS